MYENHRDIPHIEARREDRNIQQSKKSFNGTENPVMRQFFMFYHNFAMFVSVPLAVIHVYVCRERYEQKVT
jgi:hypothetical protein